MRDKFSYFIDETLAKELQTPGSDPRWGVNFIARPARPIVEGILQIQNQLRSKEPGQYYYPAEDLHLTFIEVCSGLDSAQAQSIFTQVKNNLDELFTEIKTPTLKSPQLHSDARACSLIFGEVDGLGSARVELFNRLKIAGLHPSPRYSSGTAHITFMRYIMELEIREAKWEEILSSVPVPMIPEWTIPELWLTCGAN